MSGHALKLAGAVAVVAIAIIFMVTCFWLVGLGVAGQMAGVFGAVMGVGGMGVGVIGILAEKSRGSELGRTAGSDSKNAGFVISAIMILILIVGAIAFLGYTFVSTGVGPAGLSRGAAQGEVPREGTRENTGVGGAGASDGAEAGPQVRASLQGGDMLGVCNSLSSPNGQFKLSLECNGRLVLYGPGNNELWTPENPGYLSNTATLEMQQDGNLVVYTEGHVARWATKTNGHSGALARVTDDGQLVIVAENNETLFSAG